MRPIADSHHLTQRSGSHRLTSAIAALATVAVVLTGCSLLPAQLENIAGIGGTPGAGRIAPTPTTAPPSISTAALVKERSKLRVGIRFDAPPLSSVTAAGTLEGMDVDLAREFARRWLGSPDNVEFVQVTSSSAPFRIEQRDIDFALGGLLQSKPAAAHADFSLSYMSDGEALMIRTGSFADFAALARHNVTYIDIPSTNAIRDAQIAGNVTVTLQSAPSYEAAIRQLRDSQTDAVVGRWRRLRAETGRDPALTVLTLFNRQPVAIMLPRSDSDWASLVNFTLSGLIADGSFAKLYKKWFYQPPETVYALPNAIDIQLANLPDKIAPHDTLSRVRLNKVVKVGFNAQADPLATLDGNGEATGFEVDIVRELAHRWLQNSGAAEFTAVPAGDIAGLLRSNAIDLAVGGIAETQSNARVMDFSSITYQGGAGIAVLQTSTATDVASLNGKIAGVIQGRNDAALLDGVKAARSLNITSHAYPDINALFDALRNGEIDAVIADQTSLIAVARTAKDIKVLSERLSNIPIGIALARDDSTFKTFVNLTLQDMFADGTYALVYKKWFAAVPPAVELWSGNSTVNTMLVAPTETPLPTMTPIFSSLPTPAPGSIPPTPLPAPTATPNK